MEKNKNKGTKKGNKIVDVKKKNNYEHNSNAILDFIMNNDKTIKTFLIGLIIGLAIFYVKDINRVTKLSNGDELVVTASGVEISANELYSLVKDKYAINVLIDEIDDQLLTKKYPINDEMQKQIDDQIAGMKEQIKDDFLNTIKQYYGFNSEDELRDALALNLRRENLTTEYIKDNLSDKEINDHYKNNIIGDIKASHILIKADVTDEMSEEEISTKEEEAKSLANELITKLDNGEKFEDLAKEYSKDEGSAENGGDLDYFNKGDMVPEFEEAVLKLENGTYTKEPVKSQFGYHIILKVDQKEKEALDNIKEDIITTLTTKKIEENNTIYYQALIDFRKNKKIDIIDGKLKSQYENLKSSWLTKNTNN